MSPSVTGTLWREVRDSSRTEPLIIDGHVVPAGTQVGVHVYSLHHNERYFTDPFEYRPERWLEGDEETKKRRNSAFAPFSIGSRGCAGKPMAYLEMSLAIAKTLWFFDFKKAPGALGKVGEGHPEYPDGRRRVNEFQLRDIFAALHDGPNLVFQPREGVAEGASKE